MSIELESDETDQDGLSWYAITCYGCLALMLLPLIARGVGDLMVIPSLLGAVAVAFRWKTGPLVYLLTILLFSILSQLPWYVTQYFARSELLYVLARSIDVNLEDHVPVLDLIYCTLLLLYVVCHYRHLGISTSIFPVDRRTKKVNALAKKKGKAPRYPDPIRSPALVQPQELLILGATGFLSAVLAQVVWVWLEDRAPGDPLLLIDEVRLYLRMEPRAWQFLVLIWNGVLVILIATSILAWLGFQRMTREEAYLILQDELWKQTRREQSRIHRWLAWGNRKRAWPKKRA